MKKILISLRIDPKMKKFFEKYAERDNRSLANFLINAGLEHIREKFGVDWHAENLNHHGKD